MVVGFILIITTIIIIIFLLIHNLSSLIWPLFKYFDKYKKLLFSFFFSFFFNKCTNGLMVVCFYFVYYKGSIDWSLVVLT